MTNENQQPEEEKSFFDNLSDKFEELKDNAHLKSLFHEAHICISWSFQKSGTKLKLMNALFNSRHSIINENIIVDTAIISLCSIAQNKEMLKEKITILNQQPYSSFDLENRKKILENQMNDLQNALKINEVLKGLN